MKRCWRTCRHNFPFRLAIRARDARHISELGYFAYRKARAREIGMIYTRSEQKFVIMRKRIRGARRHRKLSSDTDLFNSLGWLLFYFNLLSLKANCRLINRVIIDASINDLLISSNWISSVSNILGLINQLGELYRFRFLSSRFYQNLD